jgi:uncharacterized phiE125 gp8 family phage protein
MLELITAPALEPVTYMQVIHHLRMNPFDEAIDEASEQYITQLVKATRKACEVFTNRAFITQTWKQYLQDWPSKDYIELFKPPLRSVTSITILTNDDPPATFDPTYYLVDTISVKGKIVLAEDQSWPSVDLYPVNPIQIEFVCGYGAAPENVEEAIRNAILWQVGDLYDNREDYRDIKLSRVSERLLWPYRVFF